MIKERAALFIATEANTDPLITITHATVAPDYRQATIYITTLPEGREADALIFLKRLAGQLRRHIMKQSNLKIVPQLTFDLDVNERHRQHNLN